ncbi:DUF3526 domain-containing protein [Xylophilus sp. Leaf220]|uniref:DUF3526 domain-containing protein n=1 Tax=Xylophilus sp. Leaf220 TaxID=1735686 RepID=UPI0006FE9F7E|nr:DUF3526 domain-containing protein [Xylophilus sp. Leaf220]KQM78939.1 hypothetical protein ASE76_16245 [Xylophilus sp. Leaf220]
MNPVFSACYWRAEGSKFSRQPLAWGALAALWVVLLVTAVSAGLDARAWRSDAAQDAVQHAARLEKAVEQFRAGPPPGPARAVATYQLGRGELGSTRMPVDAGLALGIQRLAVLPVRLKASLDSRHVDARDPGPLRNPMLADAALPGLPAMVALLLPLVALVLCAGLVQEEREQGRLALLRLQSRHGVGPVLVAALGWRFIALWGVAVAATLPALALDPGATARVALQWSAALGIFCAFWVVVGGVVSCAPLSGAASMLAALGIWLVLTFAVPAALVQRAGDREPMPSRLAAVLAIRHAQQEGEDNETELARAWYAAHPEVPAKLPPAWPASFVPRVLAQDRELQPLAQDFQERRSAQAVFVGRWSWSSPGLALVLFGQRLAGTDAARHAHYLERVDAFEADWREFLVPRVMDLQGMGAGQVEALPRFGR